MAKRSKRTLEPRTARINFRATTGLHSALIELAREDGRSLSDYVERVLDEHVRSRSTRSRSPKKTS
jgi:predicted HicB family RNase H-like nuclease